MKRVWIAVGVLTAVVVVGILSLLNIKSAVGRLEQELILLEELVQSGAAPAELEKQSIEFEAVWEQEEATLMHFIHHNALDDITGVVARLKSLARFSEKGEFAAEVARLRHLVEHVYEAEKPGLTSVF